MPSGLSLLCSSLLISTQCVKEDQKDNGIEIKESLRLEKTTKIKFNTRLPSPPLNHIPQDHTCRFL